MPPTLVLRCHLQRDKPLPARKAVQEPLCLKNISQISSSVIIRSVLFSQDLTYLFCDC